MELLSVSGLHYATKLANNGCSPKASFSHKTGATVMLAGTVGSEEVVMAFLNCKEQQGQKPGHRILGSDFLIAIKDQHAQVSLHDSKAHPRHLSRREGLA